MLEGCWGRHALDRNGFATGGRPTRASFARVGVLRPISPDKLALVWGTRSSSLVYLATRQRRMQQWSLTFLSQTSGACLGHPDSGDRIHMGHPPHGRYYHQASCLWVRFPTSACLSRSGATAGGLERGVAWNRPTSFLGEYAGWPLPRALHRRLHCFPSFFFCIQLSWLRAELFNLVSQLQGSGLCGPAQLIWVW